MLKQLGFVTVDDSDSGYSASVFKMKDGTEAIISHVFRAESEADARKQMNAWLSENLVFVGEILIKIGMSQEEKDEHHSNSYL